MFIREDKYCLVCARKIVVKTCTHNKYCSVECYNKRKKKKESHYNYFIENKITRTLTDEEYIKSNSILKKAGLSPIIRMRINHDKR